MVWDILFDKYYIDYPGDDFAAKFYNNNIALGCLESPFYGNNNNDCAINNCTFDIESDTIYSSAFYGSYFLIYMFNTINPAMTNLLNFDTNGNNNNFGLKLLNNKPLTMDETITRIQKYCQLSYKRSRSLLLHIMYIIFDTYMGMCQLYNQCIMFSLSIFNHT